MFSRERPEEKALRRRRGAVATQKRVFIMPEKDPHVRRLHVPGIASFGMGNHFLKTTVRDGFQQDKLFWVSGRGAQNTFGRFAPNGPISRMKSPERQSLSIQMMRRWKRKAMDLGKPPSRPGEIHEPK